MIIKEKKNKIVRILETSNQSIPLSYHFGDSLKIFIKYKPVFHNYFRFAIPFHQ